MKLIKLLLLIFLLSVTQASLADDDVEFAKATQNPLARNPKAKYYALPFINNFNLGYGPNNNVQNVLNLKPIIPFPLTNTYDFIVRPILPFYHQPSLGKGNGYINGFGDINPTAFISPAVVSELFMWGFGPSLFIPTATNKTFGTGRWSIGPQLAIFSMPGRWVIGILTSNVWSIAGDKHRPPVDQFSLQYFISYNFSKGWYITSQPTITANWQADANKQWLVPFGVGAGRAFHYKGQAMNLAVEGYYNAVRPATMGPDWIIQAKVDLLFPII